MRLKPIFRSLVEMEVYTFLELSLGIAVPQSYHLGPEFAMAGAEGRAQSQKR